MGYNQDIIDKFAKALAELDHYIQEAVIFSPAEVELLQIYANQFQRMIGDLYT